jgi:hypothetical protein
MTQELTFTQPELALAELRIKRMIMQSLKHNTEMLFMLFLRKEQDLINEDHDKLVHLFHENRVDEVSGGIGRTKRHHQILIRDLGVGRNQWQESVQGTPIEKTRIKIGGMEESLGPRVAYPSATSHEDRYMMPCSQGREGIIFRWWKLRGEDELQCMTSDIMRTITQKKAGGCMRVSASSQDVLGYCRTEKVVSVVPLE